MTTENDTFRILGRKPSSEILEEWLHSRVRLKGIRNPSVTPEQFNVILFKWLEKRGWTAKEWVDEMRRL